MKINVADTATNAPAMIDGHDAADLAGEEEGSAVMTAGPGVIICSTIFSSAVRTHRQQKNDRKRNSQHPKQYSTTHNYAPLY
jgi:hypothetical protein